jgi:hypothetical protein
MKYMIEYTVRAAGASYDQNIDNQEALLNAFAKWQPDNGLTIHAFVSSLVNSGYVLVEADDPQVVASFIAKFTYWNDVNVVPVVDVQDAVATGNEAIAWARSATSS